MSRVFSHTTKREIKLNYFLSFQSGGKQFHQPSCMNVSSEREEMCTQFFLHVSYMKLVVFISPLRPAWTLVSEAKELPRNHRSFSGNKKKNTTRHRSLLVLERSPDWRATQVLSGRDVSCQNPEQSVWNAISKVCRQPGGTAEEYLSCTTFEPNGTLCYYKELRG